MTPTAPVLSIPIATNERRPGRGARVHEAIDTTIEVGGHRFDASIAGNDEAPLVLLLHGFPQTRHTWRAELPALAQAGFRACAPDQRGYSAGARPTGVEAYRIELLVEDVLGFADALGADTFHLVGHDWGGHLAWTTAALHSERIESLCVLSRPHPAAFAAASAAPEQQKRSSHHRSFLRPEATDELLADDAKGLRRAFERQGVRASDAAAYLETLGNHSALDAAIHWYRAAPLSAVKASEVPAVKVPTLFFWGNVDATVGRPAAEGTRDFVDAPYAFVEVEGAGHFITDDSPAAVTEKLVDHVRAGRARE